MDKKQALERVEQSMLASKAADGSAVVALVERAHAALVAKKHKVSEKELKTLAISNGVPHVSYANCAQIVKSADIVAQHNLPLELIPNKTIMYRLCTVKPSMQGAAAAAAADGMGISDWMRAFKPSSGETSGEETSSETTSNETSSETTSNTTSLASVLAFLTTCSDSELDTISETVCKTIELRATKAQTVKA